MAAIRKMADKVVTDDTRLLQCTFIERMLIAVHIGIRTVPGFNTNSTDQIA